MELILKPTSRCNFACTYCSAKNLQLQTLTTVNTKLKQILKILNPSTIILTGGDPLCVDPQFYSELLLLGNWKLSFTTNLKDFMLNPQKWKALFSNPRVGVCTSFQCGTTRKYDSETVYTEQLFLDTMQKFNEIIGYVPPFISVINDENEKDILKHVILAKFLRTKCKINRMMPLGLSTTQYPMYKLITHYLNLFNSQWQQQLDISTSLFIGGCGFNINGLCHSTIRAIMFDACGNMKYSSCEDDLVNNSFIEVDQVQPIPQRIPIPISEHLTSECAFCELFYLCHGCKHNRQLNRAIPEHCVEMKKIKSQILATPWKLSP